jgi:hypothetical protein
MNDRTCTHIESGRLLCGGLLDANKDLANSPGVHSDADLCDDIVLCTLRGWSAHGHTSHDYQG